MPCQASIDQWQTTIMQHLPQLSKPQAPVLALWSFGMVQARSCALRAVSAMVATGQGRHENTRRQRLREGYDAAPTQRGSHRQALQVETCCAPLLRWIVSGWQGSQLALALAATTLGACLVVLVSSVVSRGCAIPVAWVLLPAGAKHAGRREWLRLVRRRRRAVLPGWPVIGLADRGLDAPWLLRRMTRLGWHPFGRMNRGGRFRPLGTLVPRPGTSWRGVGRALTRNPVACALLAPWEDGDKAPWLILTDLAPAARDAGWYGLRAWIDQGFKLTKRAGWPWHRTRMTAPARAARLGLAVAVATLWLVRIGGAVDATIPAGTWPAVSALCPGYRRPRRATRWRLVSIFRRGWLTLMGALRRQAPLPAGRFVPESWPAIPSSSEDRAEEDTSALPRAA